MSEQDDQQPIERCALTVDIEDMIAGVKQAPELSDKEKEAVDAATD